MFEQIIPRRNRACFLCDRAFQPGDDVLTQLRDLQRSDFCSACAGSEGSSCQWRSQVPLIAEEARQPASGEERALLLLRERFETPDGYLLALYLERAGRLQRYRGKGPPLFEDVETGEVFQVASSSADSEAAARLIAELSGEDSERSEDDGESDDVSCCSCSLPRES